MNGDESPSDDPLMGTVDRISSDRNLITRSSSAKHVLPEAVDGRVPEPGERLRVRKVSRWAHPIALEPREHVETITDYVPLYESKVDAPKKRDEKRVTRSGEIGSDPGCFDLGPIRSRKVTSETAGAKGVYTSSKNHLLKGIDSERFHRPG